MERKTEGSLYANIWPWLVRAHLCPRDNRRRDETKGEGGKGREEGGKRQPV